MDYMIEPENKLIRFGPEVIEEIRKEYNLNKKEDREEAIRILEEWVKEQDHLVKKDYDKRYLEKCIITSKGSIERAKLQIDKMCTMRTLVPKYFQTNNILETDIREDLERCNFALVPTLTKELYRIIIIRCKPNTEYKQSDYNLLFKMFVVVAEYLKCNDFCRGYVLMGDMIDTSTTNVLSKINLAELQQFIPVMTEGYGSKIKGIIFLTGSKFIDGFVRLVKPLFSEKIASRIHVSTSKTGLQEFMPVDILPQEYGGKEQPVQVLHDNLVKTLCAEKHQERMKEMNSARTDESKRQLYKFNEKYMGMPGTFRTLSLD